MSSIGIINCGLGNLTSVKNALYSSRVECQIVDEPEEIVSCDKIILPGVGAFAAFMGQLHLKGFVPYIHEHILKEKPLMGICLGMQVLFEMSEEFQNTKGLGILKGQVVSLPEGKLPIPNVGWWTLKGNYGAFSERIHAEDTFYFVHSFHCKPSDEYKGLYIDFNGREVLAGVQHKNIFGYQFHPEKSQKSGQKLIKEFASL